MARRWVDKQSLDIREYRVGFRQQAMSREEAQSSMFKMLQEAWEKNNGFDDDEWGETQSPPFILKRATDKKVIFRGGQAARLLFECFSPHVPCL